MKPLSVEDVIKRDFVDVDEETLFNIEEDIDSLIHNIVFGHNEFGGDGQLKYGLARCFQSTCGGEVLDAISKVLIEKNREVSEIDGELAHFLVTVDYFDIKGTLDGTLVYPKNTMDECLELVREELNAFTECGIGVTINDTYTDKVYQYEDVLKMVGEITKTKIRYVNCTPHVVRLNDGTEFLPSGYLARVTSSHTEFDKDKTCKVVYGDVNGVPEPQDGVIYIVSLIVLNASDRTDLVAPATSHPDVVRKDGQVYSVPGFVRK